MFKIALCDDSPDFLALIEDMVQSVFKRINPAFKLTIRRFDQGQALVDDLSRGSRYDLILLDWDMPGQNGADTGKAIRRLDQDCLFVFVSAFDHCAVQASKLTTFRFIMKDKLIKELPEALQSAYDKLFFKDLTIQIRNQNKIDRFIRVREIIFIESHCKKTIVSLRQQEKIIVSRFFLKEHAHILLQNGFAQPYHGVYINVQEISKLNHIEVILSDGSKFPVSRRCEKDVLLKIQQMMGYES